MIPLKVGVGLANASVSIITKVISVVTASPAIDIIKVIGAIKAKSVTKIKVTYVGY